MRKKERREQQMAEKNESREAVPRAGVEINTAVKDAGKAERKAVTQKRQCQEKISRREGLIWV